MNCTILNREFRHPTDGWYQVEARGYHPLGDGRKIVQVIDPQAIASIANRFNADVASSSLRNGNEMLIDREHFKHDLDKDTVAFGWGRQAESREDGIYCRVDWTGTGQPAVDQGDYRFFSTEYDPTQTETVPDTEIPTDILNRFRGWKFLRPLRLDGLTLTNMHNNRGQRPITNRDKTTLPDHPADPTPAGEQADIQNRRKNTMKLIAQKLGLSADASEDAILGELVKIENRATTAEAALAPVTTERDTLKNRVQDMVTSVANSDLDEFGITTEDERNEYRPMLIANREGTRKLLARGKAPAKPAEKSQPLHNRAGAKTPVSPAANQDGEVTEADKASASRISNRAGELKAANPRRAYSDCFAQARAESDSQK